MLLKLFREKRKNSPFDRAIAISPPMQLDLCADAMNKGFSRYYQHRLMQYILHPFMALALLRITIKIKFKTVFKVYNNAYTHYSLQR